MSLPSNNKQLLRFATAYRECISRPLSSAALPTNRLFVVVFMRFAYLKYGFFYLRRMCGLWLQLQLQLQVTWRDSNSVPATRWRQNANMLQQQDCVARRASCGANQNKARQKSSRHLDLTARKLASSALDKLVKILKQLMSATGCCT